MESFYQVSDISVINQLYLLNRDVSNNKVDCDFMNVRYLFLSSFYVFLLYRFLSSLMIYRYFRGDVRLTILQFFDLAFIQTLYINYQFHNTAPCSPQRYLTNLEAMFESYPHFVIRIYFLVSLNAANLQLSNYNDNVELPWVVTLSILINLLSITSKKWTQDKDLIHPQWQQLKFNHKPIEKLLGISSSKKDLDEQSQPTVKKAIRSIVTCCTHDFVYEYFSIRFERVVQL